MSLTVSKYGIKVTHRNKKVGLCIRQCALSLSHDKFVLIVMMKFWNLNHCYYFQDVLHRHPLYTVAQVIHYVDSFDKNNVAFKIGQVQPGSAVCDCHIFQCQSEVRIVTIVVLLFQMI